MEPTNNTYRDLYLMLAPNFDTKHLIRSNKGEEGFEDFVRTNNEFLRNEAIAPDNWMFHYHFSEEQTREIKAVTGLRSKDYFRILLPALLERNITPEEIYTRDESRYLNLSDTPLSSFINRDFDLALVRPPFNAYVAVDTIQGVLLFSHTPTGTKLFEGYMQNLADTFFSPQMPQNGISISKIPAFDPALKPFVDRCPKFKSSPYKQREETSLPAEIFAPENILDTSVNYLEITMKPTWKDFYAFIFPTEKSGLHFSADNYSIMRLLHIKDTGRIPLYGMETLPYNFKYIKEFSDLIDAVPGNANLDNIKLRADELLTRDFPNIRGTLSEKIAETHQQFDVPFQECLNPRIKF